MKGTVSIHQGIFGYRDGHHLLTSSTNLEPKVRQLLATLTDGSGPYVTNGFDVSYNGQYIPDTNYFAFFCTWPAPEMPRPGCVWSHVLLIDLADLARIQNLKSLMLAFVRPDSSKGFSDFENPFILMLDNIPSIYLSNIYRQKSSFLLTALYSSSEEELVILDDDNHDWEEVLFSIWSQQWPRLRRNFSFSTGSLGDRRISGTGYNVQIAPISTQRIWNRSERPTRVVSFNSDSGSKIEPEWLPIAEADLFSPMDRSLREFLAKFGSDVEGLRSAYIPLVQSFSILQTKYNEGPAVRLLNISQLFPKPTDAITLKKFCVSTLLDENNSDSAQGIWAVIYFLINSPNSDAFSKVPIDFGTYSKLLWDRKRSDALSLLSNISPSGNSEKLVHAISACITPADIPAICREQPSALSILVAANLSLVTDPVAWNVSTSSQKVLWESFSRSQINSDSWSKICSAMLKARCSVYEIETVNSAGENLLRAIDDWLLSDSFELPSYSWRDALKTPIRSLLKNSSLPFRVLAFAAWVLPPSEAREIRLERLDLANVDIQCLNSLHISLYLRTHFWLLALAFRKNGKAGFEVLRLSYLPVYDAVSRSQYPGEAWDILSPVLPELIFGWDWDRCKRLRTALSKWIKTNGEYYDSLKAELNSSAFPSVFDSFG